VTSGLNDALQFVVAPDTRFYYDNPAHSQTFGVMAAAGGVSKTASGMTALTQSLRWGRIGMTSAHWVPNISGGEFGLIARMTARDMARFGLLLEREGRWGSEQVVPASAAVAEMPGMLIPSAPADLVAALGGGRQKDLRHPLRGSGDRPPRSGGRRGRREPAGDQQLRRPVVGAAANRTVKGGG
jgi:CubicO group peptidase (beta-lactamase class C family)